MTGINYSVTVDDLDVRAALNDLLQRGESLRPAFLAIGKYLIGSHEDRFPAQKSPDGTTWAPLSEQYKKSKRKRKSRHPDLILVLNGYLANHFRYRADDNELVFGTDRIYGAVHQFGWPEKNIPPRPFLGISPSDEQKIIATLIEYLLPH
jgi:phage virion morphogenesis protein